MNKLFLYFNLLIIVLPLLFACEYEPSGANYRDIAPPDTTKVIQVNLSPLQTEYKITTPTVLNFDLNTFGLKVYSVEFLIGNQSVYTGENATGNYVLNPAPYGIGPQTLTMKVITSTNTGSIADLAGVEAFLYEKSWTLLLDGGNPNPVEITKISNNQGVLNLEWEPYTRFNFQKYILYKNFGSAEASYEKHVLAEITDQNQHSFNDLSFIGGTGNYWIEVQASNQSATSSVKSYTFDIPPIDTVWVRGDSAKFSWHKNPFFKAMSKTTLTTASAYGLPVIELFSSSNPNDTALISNNLRFGKSLQYTLSTYSNSDIRIYNENQIVRSDISFGLGKSIPKSTQIIGSQTENHVFLFDENQKLSRLEMNSLKITTSVQTPILSNWFISSFDGNVCSVFNSLLYVYNKNDLTDNKSYDSNQVLGFDHFWSNSISEQNRVLGMVPSGIGLYDMSSTKMIFTQSTNEMTPVLSPDGNYAFSITYLGYYDKQIINIYRVTDSSLVKIGQLPENVYSQYKWIPGEPHKLMVLVGYEYNSIWSTGSNIVGIWNPQTLTVENEFRVNIGHFAGIDFQTRNVAFYDVFPGTDDKHKLYVYNYETGMLVKEISLAPRFDALTIYHSYVFSGDGFCLDYSKF